MGLKTDRQAHISIRANISKKAEMKRKGKKHGS